MKKYILIFLIIILLTGCSFKKDNENNTTVQEIEEIIKEDNVEVKYDENNKIADISEELESLFDLLIKYGGDLYDKKEYKPYKINSSIGSYFMSLNDMNSYDISSFIEHKCNKDKTGVYFTDDEDNISITPVLIECE